MHISISSKHSQIKMAQKATKEKRNFSESQVDVLLVEVQSISEMYLHMLEYSTITVRSSLQTTRNGLDKDYIGS